LGNGDGSFRTQQNFAPGPFPSAVAVADVNHDRIPDLAVANDGGVSVLLGNGDGSFRTRQTFAAGPSPRYVAVADANGDGRAAPVFAASAVFSGGVTVLLGNGDGSFTPLHSFATDTSPRSVAVADVNGDGKPDVIVANYAGSSVGVLLG